MTIPEYIAAGTATITCIGFILKAHAAGSRHLRRLDVLIDDVGCIKAEMRSNGGSSLRDVVVGIQKEVERNTNLTKIIVGRQRWILDNRDEPIFEADKEGKVVWTNQSYLRTFTVTPREVLNNGWKNLIHQSDRENVILEWESAIADNRDFEREFKMYRGENSTNISCVATMTEDGSYIGSIKIL